ncbi:MAG: phosphoserine phosphatase SerB [Thiohalospira sp.]
MSQLLLHTPDPEAPNHPALAAIAADAAEPRSGHWRLPLARPLEVAELEGLREQVPFDLNPLPEGFEPGRVGLFISDMDSTLITIECVDEIADFAGRKAEVAAVTEAAMRGEIGFEESLTQRVEALTGLDEDVLGQIYRNRLRLNPGAEALLAGLAERAIPRAVVSGGFTYFTDGLQRDYGIEYALANVLEMDDGRLTGRVQGAIVGAARKRAFLEELCGQLGLAPEQAIAAGDGANDLPMLERAGLGVAFRAKPRVRAEADAVLHHAGLDAILHFLEN